jgi:[ribosomal protein S18]-alanine N-acetyltransferase
MNAKIRIFKDEDFWQVENLVRKFMSNDPFSPPIIVRQMQDLFGPFFLVAVSKDSSNRKEEIQGYIIGGIKFEQKSVGWVLGIYVKEEYRDLGIGDDLLHTLIPKLKSAGVSEIWLTVDPQNVSAIKIYRKNGFHEEKSKYEHYRRDKTVLFMRNVI